MWLGKTDNKWARAGQIASHEFLMSHSNHALVFWIQFCVSPPHDGIWVYWIRCNCQGDASSRGNARPVPQLGLGMVDLDAGVGQQFLLHRSVHRGHAIWGRAPHVDVIQEREEPFFRPQSSLNCNQRIVLPRAKVPAWGVSLLASLPLQNLMQRHRCPAANNWMARHRIAEQMATRPFRLPCVLLRATWHFEKWCRTRRFQKSVSSVHQQNEVLTGHSIWRAQIQVAPLMHHFVRSRRFTTGSGPFMKVQHRASERPCGSAAQDRAPPGLSSTLHSPPADGWLWSGFRFCQQARNSTFPPDQRPTFARAHDQSGPSVSTHQLWVSPFFQAPGTDQRHSVTLSSTRPRNAVSTDGGTPAWCQGRDAPPKRGRPSPTTSNLRPSSAGCGTPRSKSRTMILVVTRAPASRHTLAAAISTVKPRLTSKPTREHAARWWPEESKGRPQRQMGTQGGRGKRRQRSSNKRNRCDSMRVWKHVGAVERAALEKGPL